MKLLAAFLLICLSCSVASGQASLDAAQETRAKALYNELRCVVCQNQSIGDSDADVAKDLRAIVSEQIAEGRSDIEVKQFLVDRYGEFILLKPVLAWHTLVLWVTPVILLLFGAGFAWSRRNGAMPEAATALTAEEEQRLADLLDK